MEQYCVRYCIDPCDAYGVVFLASKELCEEFCKLHEKDLNVYGDQIYFVDTIDVVTSMEQANKYA